MMFHVPSYSLSINNIRLVSVYIHHDSPYNSFISHAHRILSLHYANTVFMPIAIPNPIPMPRFSSNSLLFTPLKFIHFHSKWVMILSKVYNLQHAHSFRLVSLSYLIKNTPQRKRFYTSWPSDPIFYGTVASKSK